MSSVKRWVSKQIATRNGMRLKFIPDRVYLNLKYYYFFGKNLNLKRPRTFNEKLQWLKLYDRNPRYIDLVDKNEVRNVVKEKIGDKYLVRLLGIWRRFEDIDFEELPEKFVLKTTHDSGGVFVCTDKSKMDLETARNLLTRSLRNNYFYSGREWPYKMIRPMIICEEFIGKNDNVPEDYKIMCFNGRPDNIMVCQDRDTGTTKYYFFDTDWRLMRCNGWGKMAPENFMLPKPKNLDRMLEIAKILSEGIPLARIDLYNIDGDIYFGEITLYPDSGFDNRILPETDIVFGEKLRLKNE